MVSRIGLFVALFAIPVGLLAQKPNPAPGGWLIPQFDKPPISDANRKPAPRRSLAGTWGPAGGNSAATQGGGVAARPNNGRAEQLPYTPYGLDAYRSHKALEGADAVLPADGNDPRNLCEPLGVPRYNHYNVRMTQIMQDEYKVAILYHYDNRWRVIWTDGRQLPTLVEGGVDLGGGDIREPRFFGYSVGRWVDDYTFEVTTIGTMPEDRVWLDSTGRPISDQVRVTETFRRMDYDTMVWSETIDDPKMYTKPWETMRFQLRLHDPRTDIQEYYCSPVEQERYNRLFGNTVSGK